MSKSTLINVQSAARNVADTSRRLQCLWN